MKKMLEKIKNWYENDNFKEVYSKVMSENGIDINAIKVGDQVIVRHDLHEDMDVPFGVGSEMLFWKGKMVTVTEVHPNSSPMADMLSGGRPHRQKTRPMPSIT